MNQIATGNVRCHICGMCYGFSIFEPIHVCDMDFKRKIAESIRSGHHLGQIDAEMMSWLEATERGRHE
jgi:hypothetical protein